MLKKNIGKINKKKIAVYSYAIDNHNAWIYKWALNDPKIVIWKPWPEAKKNIDIKNKKKRARQSQKIKGITTQH